MWPRIFQLNLVPRRVRLGMLLIASGLAGLDVPAGYGAEVKVVVRLTNADGTFRRFANQRFPKYELRSEGGE